MKSIYLIDDDIFFNKKFELFLKQHGFFVKTFTTAEDAWDSLNHYVPDLILTDLRLPGMSGLDLLKKVKISYLRLPVILITNYSDVRTAVKSIKIGAYEFISKPVNPDELLQLVHKAIELAQLPEERDSVIQPNLIAQIIKSKNPLMKEKWQLMDKVAPTDLSVLIFGESGTGKEYAARYIHSKSKRFDKAFVVVDCGSITDENINVKLFGAHDSNKARKSNQLGFFEKANGGTLFLDEIGNLSLSNQIKILRVIQEKKIEINQVPIQLDIRIITSTNLDPEKAIKKEILRSDLYFRLNEFPIQLLPLRERKEDIVDFIQHFISEASEEMNKRNVRLTIDLINDFKEYSWPGNLRELKNLIKRGVLLSDKGIISHENLPEFNTKLQQRKQLQPENKTLKNVANEIELDLIQKSLIKNNYNKSKTAKELNITRTTLYKKMKKFGM